MSVVTRFAPSPSGRLHLGHAFSALQAWEFAQKNDGEFILRIEDIDFNRCKPEFESLLKEDLEWLGLKWQEPTRRQSDFMADFHEAADRLKEMGLLYPCFCTRKEILAEIERAGAAPHGSEGPVYPGTCRKLNSEERSQRIEAGKDHAWRLDLNAALEKVGKPIVWNDRDKGEIEVKESDWEQLGDVVLVRKDIGTSYHVAVVIDDALQGVTHIIRGKDLYESTHIHALLHELLELPKPIYHHHGLIVDESGKRLAKRDESETLAALREKGEKPEEIIDRLKNASVV